MHQAKALSVVVFALLTWGHKDLSAQSCWLSVAGLNQNRFVWGSVDAECGFEEPGCYHTTPWGNWGVTSNYGHKEDGAQFQGWHGSAPKLEWNSCTYHEWSPPNCTYYNWDNCTHQKTQGGSAVNVHGTKGVGLSVNCPQDTNGDGYCDIGGCKDVYSYGEGTNWTTLYELDPIWPWGWCGHDDLVETLYFPSTTAYLTCDAGWCSASGTSWRTPTSGWKTYAEMAMLVNFGVYEDDVYCENLRYMIPAFNCVW